MRFGTLQSTTVPAMVVSGWSLLIHRPGGVTAPCADLLDLPYDVPGA